MITHWIPLIGGVFFGLIPPRLLLNSECRYLSFEGFWSRVVTPQKSNQRKRRWWKLPLVWIDPFRGYVTAWLLTQSFEPVVKAQGFEKIAPLFATALALFIVVWVQSSGRRQQNETISPCAFLAGMMVSLLPPIVAISAIAIGSATAIALNSFAAGYIVAMLTTAGFGYLFMGPSLWLPIYTVLVAAPLLLNWICRTSLVIPVRC